MELELFRVLPIHTPNPPLTAPPPDAAPPSPHVAPPMVVAQPPRPQTSHTMVTWLKYGISQPKITTDGTMRWPLAHALSVAAYTKIPESTSYSQAVCFVQWRTTMVEEFNALLKNHTWSLVPPSQYQNIVGCKWVFRIKHNSNST